MSRSDRDGRPSRVARMEFRGEVRRGYFVRGLAGAQFAVPEAVEQLRATEPDSAAPFVVIAASDPANPYALDVEDVDRDPLSRPRGRGALLVTRDGRVGMSVEGRGRRITVEPWMADADVTAAATALLAYLRASGALASRPRDVEVETIDGVNGGDEVDPGILGGRVPARDTRLARVLL